MDCVLHKSIGYKEKIYNINFGKKEIDKSLLVNHLIYSYELFDFYNSYDGLDNVVETGARKYHNGRSYSDIEFCEKSDKVKMFVKGSDIQVGNIIGLYIYHESFEKLKDKIFFVIKSIEISSAKRQRFYLLIVRVLLIQ